MTGEERIEAKTRMPRAWISLALGLACYALLWPLQPFDVRTFLIPWMEHIVAAGPVGAFGAPFSNYAPPYLYLLAAASPLTPLITVTGAIKLVSALGALWLAWATWRLLTAAGAIETGRAAALTLLLPTTLLNAAVFGQCDALWAAPCLLAVAAATWRSRDGWLIFAGVQTGSLLALWSGMSGDPAFAAAGGVAMIAATGALLLCLRQSQPVGTPAEA